MIVFEPSRKKKKNKYKQCALQTYLHSSLAYDQNSATKTKPIKVVMNHKPAISAQHKADVTAGRRKPGVLHTGGNRTRVQQIESYTIHRNTDINERNETRCLACNRSAFVFTRKKSTFKKISVNIFTTVSLFQLANTFIKQNGTRFCRQTFLSST